LKKLLIAAWFTLFVVLWLLLTRSWAFIGDAVLMRYVVLSMSHHLAPYRDVYDINLPGTYLLDWLTLHLFGAGATALRFYDSVLLATAAGAMIVVTAPRGRVYGFCAACLLALFHARDGAQHLGQRDLAMAVLLLLSIAAVVSLSRKWQTSLALLFGVFVGAACTIKPLGILILLVSIPLIMQSTPPRRGAFLWRASVGFALPLLATLIFLRHEGVLSSFIEILTVDVPYHAHLGAQTIGYLLNWLLPPSLLAMLITVVMSYILGISRDIEDQVVMWGMVVGALSYLLQFRGYTYHRYPFVACLLLAVSLVVSRMLQARKLVFACGVCMLIFCVVLCPLYLKASLRRDRGVPDELRSLEEDLKRTHDDGVYQCIDSVGGCITALVDLHVEQPTGMMYDEFLFNQNLPVALQHRRDVFFSQLVQRPPSKLIVMAGLFPETKAGYEKLDSWPTFRNWLQSCYALDVERSFPMSQSNVSLGYRIYHFLPNVCSH
jgi:hypothetical protein